MTKNSCRVYSEPTMYFDCLIEVCSLRVNLILVSFNGAEPCTLGATIYSIPGPTSDIFNNEFDRTLFLNAIKKEVANSLGDEAVMNMDYAKRNSTNPGRIVFSDSTRMLDRAIKKKFLEQLNHHITLPDDIEVSKNG